MNAAGKQIRPGSPSETSVQASPALMGSWVESMRKDDTKRPQRNVLMYFLDNEPNLWNSTHRDVHPDPLSYDELLDRTMKFNPTRTESSLRRGILHNAVERDDGTWVWRHQREWKPRAELPDSDMRLAEELTIPDYTSLWDDLAAIEVPTLLLYGTTEQSIITDDTLAELEQRRPGTAAVGVADAGHSIQGDQPVVLAQVVTDFLAGLG